MCFLNKIAVGLNFAICLLIYVFLMGVIKGAKREKKGKDFWYDVAFLVVIGLITTFCLAMNIYCVSYPPLKKWV